jgi:hypothetical protein
MNTFTARLYRDVTCAAAAALITLMLSLGLVESTAVPPGAHATDAALFAQQPLHTWFGQPQPAVLVD